jgi:hypothetical protein
MGNFKGGTSLSARQGGVRLGEATATTAKRGLAYQRTRDDVRVTSEYVRQLYLSSRDQAVVSYLGEVGYATAEQIGKLFFYRLRRPIKKARERLKRLWELHVLDRVVAEPVVKYGFALQLVYMVGPAGRLLLAELDVKRRLPKERRGGLLIGHNVLLGEAIVNVFRDLCRDAPREVVFYGERTAHSAFQRGSRHFSLRPDGIMIISNILQDREVPFFVELDTGQRDVGSFVAKVKAYDMYYRHGDVRERYPSLPLVLVIAWAPSTRPGEAGQEERSRLADRRLRRIMDLVKSRRGNSKVLWAFTRLDTIATDPWFLLGSDGEIQQQSFFG